MEGSSEGKSPTQMAAYFMFWEKRKGKEGETVLFFHFENKGSNDTVWRRLFAWELDENLTTDGNLCNIYIELLRTEWNGRRAQGYSYTERLLLSFECEMQFFLFVLNQCQCWLVCTSNRSTCARGNWNFVNNAEFEEGCGTISCGGKSNDVFCAFFVHF